MSGLEHDRGTRLQKIAALGADRKNLPALAAELKDPDPEIRLAVIDALVFLDDPIAHPVLVRSLFDEDKRVKRRCGEVLAKRGADGLVKLFEKMLSSEKEWMREAAAMGMGQFASAALVPVLERVARGGDPKLVKHACASLERQAQKGNAPAMAAFARLGGTLKPGTEAAPVAPLAAGPAPSPAPVGLIRDGAAAPAVVRAPALPRAGGGRATDNSLGKLPIGQIEAAVARDARRFDLDAAPAVQGHDKFDLVAAPAAQDLARFDLVAAPAAQDHGKFDLDAAPDEIIIDEPPVAQRPPVHKAPPPARERGPRPTRPVAMFEDMPMGGAKPQLRDCPVCGDPTPVHAYRCPNCKEQLRPDMDMQAPRAAGGAIDDGIANANARLCAHVVDGGYAMLFQLLTLGLGGGALYSLFRDASAGGASYGKAQYKCRVVDARTGAPASAWQSFLRNVVIWFPFVIFIELALVCSSGVRLGDRLANTRVIGGDPNASILAMIWRLFFLMVLVVGGFGILFSVLARR